MIKSKLQKLANFPEKQMEYTEVLKRNVSNSLHVRNFLRQRCDATKELHIDSRTTGQIKNLRKKNKLSVYVVPKHTVARCFLIKNWMSESRFDINRINQ